jgi:hypothetical protein
VSAAASTSADPARTVRAYSASPIPAGAWRSLTARTSPIALR